MTGKEKFIGAVKTEAARIDEVMRADLARLRPQIDPLLTEVLEYGLFNGGKRVRPLLVVLAARLVGCRDDKVYELAKAFEYLHAATLFHDDVIDNAHTRRGRPAINRRFGLVAAILAGDYLHARSMDIVGDLAGREGLRVFCEATAGMVDGEFMQLRNASETNLSEEDYALAIMGKTGHLLTASCEIGALFGGADDAQRNSLIAYGKGLGSAFQMIDDLLDYTGDAVKTGKQLGNDLAEGKMTLPLIIALARAREPDRTRLTEIVASSELRQILFATVDALIEKYGGYRETKRRAQQAVGAAISALDGFTAVEVSAEKALLIGLAHYVLDRKK